MTLQDVRKLADAPELEDALEKAYKQCRRTQFQLKCKKRSAALQILQVRKSPRSTPRRDSDRS